jgi:hypothetical protein
MRLRRFGLFLARMAIRLGSIVLGLGVVVVGIAWMQNGDIEAVAVLGTVALPIAIVVGGFVFAREFRVD